ncbi:MAG: hypothetical protein ABL970_03110 [Nitrospira sp.]
MNLFGGRRTIDLEQAERIKSWVRTTWALSDDTTVMVTELECREPGCPPIETVIALLEGPGKTTQHKIHKTAAQVTQSDVKALASASGGDPHHVH